MIGLDARGIYRDGATGVVSVLTMLEACTVNGVAAERPLILPDPVRGWCLYAAPSFLSQQAAQSQPTG